MQPGSIHSHHAVNYYTILGLPPPRSASASTLSRDELKTAYHRALLLNHPDKAPKSNADPLSASPRLKSDEQYSIEEIMTAYHTLVEPSLKAAYDNDLLKNGATFLSIANGLGQKGSHLGVEIYDLEDLSYDEEEARWFKICRCGDEQGYTVTESELEKESNEGEIYVGCRGCSLFIKVLFELVEENKNV